MTAARRIDPWMFAAVAALCALGVVMVYSAGTVFAAAQYKNGAYLLQRHLAYAAAGFVALGLATQLSPDTLRRHAIPIFAVGVALLVLVLVPGLGARAGGAQRWLALGPVRFQPSEFAKLALIVMLAHRMAERAEGRVMPGLLGAGPMPYVVPAGIVMGLTILQPDFGSFSIYACVLLAMLFVAGVRPGVIFLGVLAVLPLVYHLVMASPYRLKRVLAFLNPWEYRFDIGYQLSESLLALGSGGVTGLGLGGGKQKLLFLPSAHNDFIFAIVGEELGFIGVCAVIGLFALLGARGLRAALRGADPFRLYLGFGLTFLIVLQAGLHMGVAMGVLPAKGLTLPFVSYGGSSLVACLLAAGLLLRLSAEARATTGRGQA